ncbi:MAG: amidohydrolase family protein, partial [Candidatus Aminicenantes bacterium]|nr:amidohydrolase family protein [Candidatus Aminicenantes bacterium]
TAVGVTGYPGAGNDLDESGVSTPQMDPYDAINPEDPCIKVTRLGGVTTVMTVSGTRSPINGKSVVMNLEGRLAPDLVIKRYAAQIFNMGAKSDDKYPSTLPGVVSLIKDKLNKAKQYQEKKDKSLESKEHENKELDSSFKVDLEMEALVPVIQGEVPALFITYDEVTIRNALKIIEEYNLDGIIRGAKGVLKYAEDLKQKNIPVIWAGTTNIPGRWEPFDLNYHTAAVLADKGVLFAFDPGGWGPGSRNVRNLPVPASLSVAYGLNEEKALEALTINPAKILGMDDEVGSIQTGKTANLVVWTGSPVQMSSRVCHVVINGKVIPMESIQTRLRDRYKKH